MRRRPPKLVHLADGERQVLQDRLRNGRTDQRVARRCRILLAIADPDTIVDELAQQVGLTRTGIWYVCRRFETPGLGSIYDEPRSGRPREISARERKIPPKIAHSTISLILQDADLQPHRSRYWITPTLDAEFVERASRVLWCYEQVERLAERDEVVLALDEKPNLQALERTCRQWTGPGRIRHQEFEYVRHGTVNFLVALMVHSGQMQGWCLDRNDSEHLRQVLPELLKPYRKARQIHLIWDGGPSHTAGIRSPCCTPIDRRCACCSPPPTRPG